MIKRKQIWTVYKLWVIAIIVMVIIIMVNAHTQSAAVGPCIGRFVHYLYCIKYRCSAARHAIWLNATDLCPLSSPSIGAYSSGRSIAENIHVISVHYSECGYNLQIHKCIHYNHRMCLLLSECKMSF